MTEEDCASNKSKVKKKKLRSSLSSTIPNAQALLSATFLRREKLLQDSQSVIDILYGSRCFQCAGLMMLHF